MRLQDRFMLLAVSLLVNSKRVFGIRESSVACEECQCGQNTLRTLYGWSTCSWELKELNPARPECTGEAQPILYHATWHSTSARNTSARNWQQQLDLGGDCIAPRRPTVRRLARQVAKCCLKGRSCCNVPPCVPPPVPSSGLGPCVHRRLSLRCGVRI